MRDFKQMDLHYAGIGSRKTPAETLKLMTAVAVRLAKRGWILRSGAADGADTAFEQGCNVAQGGAEIWLPWAGFNGSPGGALPTAEHHALASTVHPAWNALRQPVKNLHARNMGQVLGADLRTPVSFVICWTEDGAEDESETNSGTGGTRSAIVVASRSGIPVFNLKNQDRLSLIASAIESAESRLKN